MPAHVKHQDSPKSNVNRISTEIKKIKIVFLILIKYVKIS